MSVNVHVNINQVQNGQSQSEREQPKPRGRFTGQRLKLLRPETYRQAVEPLAEPREQGPHDHICRLLRVSEDTLSNRATGIAFNSGAKTKAVGQVYAHCQ
jgi:hypothetical protein